jgi:hypothetical protein
LQGLAAGGSWIRNPGPACHASAAKAISTEFGCKPPSPDYLRLSSADITEGGPMHLCVGGKGSEKLADGSSPTQRWRGQCVNAEKTDRRRPAATPQSETEFAILLGWQTPTLPVRLRGVAARAHRCDRQIIGTGGLTCEGTHHRGILEHLLQGVLPCVSKAKSL